MVTSKPDRVRQNPRRRRREHFLGEGQSKRIPYRREEGQLEISPTQTRSTTDSFLNYLHFTIASSCINQLITFPLRILHLSHHCTNTIWKIHLERKPA